MIIFCDNVCVVVSKFVQKTPITRSGDSYKAKIVPRKVPEKFPIRFLHLKLCIPYWASKVAAFTGLCLSVELILTSVDFGKVGGRKAISCTK